jgi:predicted enzyme related to lactoylglutathione lyase
MPRPVHFEILADDPQALHAFYADVFGWEISEFGGEQAYWFARTGGDGAPGIDGGFMHAHFP